MTGLLLGLTAGVGAAAILAACTDDSGPARLARGTGVGGRLADLLAEAGVGRLTPAHVLWLSAACSVLALFVVGGVSRSVVLSVAFAALAATAPVVQLRRMARKRRDALRAVWPDVVDDLASAVRAGLSLPDALGQLATHGHPSVAPAFHAFTVDYGTVGRFGVALDALKERLADPVADRIVESLRLAREVGGTDLGRLLRTLSAFLREDARLRAELEVRQGWTVNAARLAAAAPWCTLGLLSLQPEAVAAYDTAAGVLVLLVGAVVTFVAYRVMLRVGHLPQDPRVLR